MTSSGEETYNTSVPGDYIVQNQTRASEQYIVPAEKFSKRYEKLCDLDDGQAEYSPLGRVVAITLTENLERFDLGRRFRFESPWGEPGIAMVYDMIVSPPDYSEVYRIAFREIEETYRLQDEEE